MLGRVSPTHVHVEDVCLSKKPCHFVLDARKTRSASLRLLGPWRPRAPCGAAVIVVVWMAGRACFDCSCLCVITLPHILHDPVKPGGHALPGFDAARHNLPVPLHNVVQPHSLYDLLCAPIPRAAQTQCEQRNGGRKLAQWSAIRTATRRFKLADRTSCPPLFRACA